MQCNVALAEGCLSVHSVFIDYLLIDGQTHICVGHICAQRTQEYGGLGNVSLKAL